MLTIENRAGVDVLVMGNGCRPASEAESAFYAEITRLRAEVEALKAENAALASWQCLFTDGTTGLYHDGCGNAQCARDHLVVHLTAEAEALRADAARLDCGQIMIDTRDEFGEPTQVWHTGMNLRAAIDAARAAQGASDV